MKKRSILYLVLAALLVIAFFLTQFRFAPDSRPVRGADEIARLAARNDLNVVFILVDTLRADRLGAYGYERPTSPTLDHLARTGVRFANHLSQSSWTKTSMASIWTASYPRRNGILRHDHTIPESALLPAEIFRDAGFVTAGIWRNGWVAPTFGFEQGFEIYHRPEIGALIYGVRRESRNPYAKIEGSDVDATEGAAEFFRANRTDRFFLYVHYMDAHQYLADEESSIFGTAYSDLYDNSIHWTDRQIASVLAALDASGLREKTIVVIASDHGEAFQEHGNEGHAKDLHAEVVRTPWILSLPFSLERPIVVDALTENIDIWPTLLDLLDLEPMEYVDGVSRVPEVLAAAGVDLAGRTRNEPKPGYSELDRSWGRADSASQPLIAVTVDHFRFMRGFGVGKGTKLYDAAVDPRESQDLSRAGTPIDLNRFDALIDAYLELPDPPWLKDVGRVELDDLQKGQLRAIGYAIE